MKWFLIIFQMISTFKSITQTKALLDKAKDVAEQSKRMAFFSFTILISLVYWFAGSIIAAIDLGHQLNSDYSIQWSGMLWASLGLIIFGLFIFSVGLIVLKFPSDSDSEKNMADKPASKELSEALERLAITFINQMVKNLVEPKEKSKTENTEGLR